MLGLGHKVHIELKTTSRTNVRLRSAIHTYTVITPSIFDKPAKALFNCNGDSTTKDSVKDIARSECMIKKGETDFINDVSLCTIQNKSAKAHP